MEKEINFNDLTTEEKVCFYILQSIVKDRYLSYGYSDDKICISKVDEEWLTYIVDRGEIFNLEKSSSIYDASREVFKEIAENKEEYNKLINAFTNSLEEFINDFNEIISEKDVLWLEKVKAIHQAKDTPDGVKKMSKALNKRKIKIFGKK